MKNKCGLNLYNEFHIIAPYLSVHMMVFIQSREGKLPLLLLISHVYFKYVFHFVCVCKTNLKNIVLALSPDLLAAFEDDAAGFVVFVEFVFPLVALGDFTAFLALDLDFFLLSSKSLSSPS